jgi:hypothetical protein
LVVLGLQGQLTWTFLRLMKADIMMSKTTSFKFWDVMLVWGKPPLLIMPGDRLSNKNIWLLTIIRASANIYWNKPRPRGLEIKFIQLCRFIMSYLKFKIQASRLEMEKERKGYQSNS